MLSHESDLMDIEAAYLGFFHESLRSGKSVRQSHPIPGLSEKEPLLFVSCAPIDLGVSEPLRLLIFHNFLKNKLHLRFGN